MSKPLVQYATFTNENRELAIDAKAPKGVRLKIRSPKTGSTLGVFQVPHRDLPAMMFELTGGAAAEQELADAQEIVEAFQSGENSPQGVAMLTRRLLLALHINATNVIAAEALGEAPGPAEEPGGCQGCRDFAESYENATHPHETMQDPDYNPDATPVEDPEPLSPEDVRQALKEALQENESLRTRLMAVAAVLDPTTQF
ncbi:hypothetical protein SEA_CHOCOLAT_93 [Arthrobacter phage Chocolat]|uniref:Uncharacterized protein n=10 Tax=Klausavirus princesstrina TaxID=1984784 RepID=A0A286N4A6_9CAUD|nr:hypothetical protein SEA_CONBOY_91 [Arthrobacter phage Conboy]AOZ64644.1 hypothetical protein SEA_CHUBSTER_93 [Arthrobacter phage Chubster]AOZ64756.1 hypothetical protein SEA_CHOCOLAT_93 [Arthrobacter phage Chocolat]APC44887.1 hypothetical protein SEA_HUMPTYDUMPTY_93 [Arthrobacter phage HumptyDumpty]ASX98877.1 hypothetical protein SEA_KABREEZE_93 [Arthrobacter phage Kabreeze]ASX99101.1 hypothetical protein SEA_SCAVITO_94 [Arthrobacter phage Scavito]ASX99213.1 hypothetical protein SEA_TOPHA